MIIVYQVRRAGSLGFTIDWWIASGYRTRRHYPIYRDTPSEALTAFEDVLRTGQR